MHETSAQKYDRFPKLPKRPRIRPPIDESLLAGYRLLERIGLSKNGARCYGYLTVRGRPTRAEELYTNLKLSRTTVYRVMGDLEKRGFIKKMRVGTLQTTFRALPLDLAMARHAEYQRKLVAGLILEQRQLTDQ